MIQMYVCALPSLSIFQTKDHMLIICWITNMVPIPIVLIPSRLVAPAIISVHFCLF